MYFKFKIIDEDNKMNPVVKSTFSFFEGESRQLACQLFRYNGSNLFLTESQEVYFVFDTIDHTQTVMKQGKRFEQNPSIVFVDLSPEDLEHVFTGSLGIVIKTIRREDNKVIDVKKARKNYAVSRNTAMDC